MTNPNNAIGTNGAFGGRTSVNAFNDVMGALSRGVLSGWACVPNSGLTVSLGGDGTTRDVAIAEDNAGNKTSINNISNSPVNVTIGAAPGANSRIDSIVAYVDNPPTGSASETDNPDACGLIVVEGTPASTPSPANDGAIRTAITADGASGTTAYYVVLAYVTMASGTTDITANEIVNGDSASLTTDKIVKAQNIDFDTMPRIVQVDFGTGESSTTSRILLVQRAVSGLDTGWEYMCTFCAGLITGKGQDGAVALVDLTIVSPQTDITQNGRIRGSYYQSSIMYTVPFIPPASSFTMNFNGNGTEAGLAWEDVQVYFIPIRPQNS